MSNDEEAETGPSLRKGDQYTVLSHRRIDKITTIQIMEQDLDAIAELSAKESRALAFFTTSGGAFVSLLGSWVMGQNFSAMAVLSIPGILVALAGLTIFFGFNWWDQRKKMPERIEKIREKATLREESKYAGGLGVIDGQNGES